MLSVLIFSLFAYKFFFDGKALDSLFPKRISINVFAKRYSHSKAQNRVVLVARADAPKKQRFFLYKTNLTTVLLALCVLGNTLTFISCVLYLFSCAPENTPIFNFLSSLSLLFLIFYLAAILLVHPTKAASGLSFIDGFKGLCITYYGSTAIETGNEALNSLVATRGMTGMLNTVFLIIAASTFGGTLVGSGMLQSLTDALVRFVKRRVSMVTATVGTGVFANMITGDQYLSILLTSSLYKKLYQERGYESKLLSRSVEDSATVVSVLIPWNSCGMTQATVLKVPTLEYLPYCFFNIISPFMSILIAAIGYKIVKKSN